MPKQYGALYKYELKPLRTAEGKMHFKADFLNENFIFEQDHTLRFVDVNKQEHVLFKR
ncbi:hypothetical protein [Bacillus sp. J33]|uniref:hypothetical protein n=1 Tax=Bacillus sp. J33 TaxID=935836 RepID=UPI0004B3B23B|nr:hypothetical protein [Bacillus sp. J33]